jgi:hypothetical protein
MHGHDHDGPDDMNLPPLPAKPDVGFGGKAIVILAICTSTMQGLFVVNSAHEMHLWNNVASFAQKVATWTPDTPKNVDLPAMNLSQ